MRKAPQFLSYFFIVISVQRVAAYIANALHVQYMGWPFAFGIAFGIYTGMYYEGTEVAKKAGKSAAWMFIIVDLIFNEFELIRELSSKVLISPESNFLGIGNDGLAVMIQITAILFGAIPTLAIGFLGNLQNKADLHWQNKPTALGKMSAAVSKMFGKFTWAFAVRAESFADNFMPNAEGRSQKMPNNAVRKSEKDLTASDIAFIANNNRPAIMAQFGISDGTAGNWIRKYAPRQTAKKLPENAEK